MIVNGLYRLWYSCLFMPKFRCSHTGVMTQTILRFYVSSTLPDERIGRPPLTTLCSEHIWHFYCSNTGGQ